MGEAAATVSSDFKFSLLGRVNYLGRDNLGKVIKRKQDTLSRSLLAGCGLLLLFVSL